MGGKLRYLLAAAFAALYFAIPDVDHDHLAYLRTRAWLNDTALQQFVVDGRIAPLAADVESAARAADYERTVRVWARSRQLQVEPTQSLRLDVDVDEAGFTASLSDGAGGAPVRLALARDGSLGYYPDRTSTIPAFLAIALAILTGKVIPSLLLGCLVGAWLATGGALAGVQYFVTDNLWARVLLQSFNLRIMGFVILLFMAIGVMARSGGIQGMVEWVRKFARGPISTQLCSYVIGILIFFDDYSNCIITGTTMRPLCDRNRVSREKLAYIVDSTAAPIAGISIVSTWIAYEISMFRDQLPEVTHRVRDAVTGVEMEVAYTVGDAFSVFVQTLPYRFYCIFTLALVLLTILTRREFGPMLAAERRAVHDGKPAADDAKPMLARGLAELEAPSGARIRGRNAFVPVVVLVSCALGLMLFFGYTHPDRGPLSGAFGDDLRAILANAQSERALLYSSAIALLVAAAMAIGSGVLRPRQTAAAAVRSFSSLYFAVVILVLAWAIGNTCKDLGTAQYLTAAFQSAFSAWLLPVVLFLLAALVAFSTGTSYGTMAILLPNVVVLAHTVGESAAIGGVGLMLLSIGAVLEGSIFGDHCSPISDTTVLSSVATASDHLHHVRTQAPYAVLGMSVAMLFGYLPMALWSPAAWPLALVGGLGALLLWLFVVGSRPETAAPRSA